MYAYVLLLIVILVIKITIYMCSKPTCNKIYIVYDKLNTASEQALSLIRIVKKVLYKKLYARHS